MFEFYISTGSITYFAAKIRTRILPTKKKQEKDIFYTFDYKPFKPLFRPSRPARSGGGAASRKENFSATDRP